MASDYSFPANFKWGVATASYQIEGAFDADGRRPSVWDTFSKTPGKVKHGDTGDVACDHYHRFKDDIKLMKELGVSMYRFSIAWPRVVPDGDGAVNQKGLDFYSRLVDALLEAGITPYATCYHWDMPEATYQKHGGWHGRQSAYDLARYAGICAKALGDRVENWMTINEFVCFTVLGYGHGIHAPGEKVEYQRLAQLIHHALLGHGLSVDAIRANAPRKVNVGLAENPSNYMPVMETPEHIDAARACFRIHNGGMLVPVLTGNYNPLWFELQKVSPPKMEAGDMAQISRPLDFVALNIYSGSFARATAAGPEVVNVTETYPTYNIHWLKHTPDCLYWTLRFVGELAQKPLFISENGCCAFDALNEKGECLDVDRVEYLRAYLRAAQRATADGVDLKGYFLWSLMDNFEWAEGYSKRFGIYHVDFNTQERKQKLSAQWYARVARENKVL